MAKATAVWCGGVTQGGKVAPVKTGYCTNGTGDAHNGSDVMISRCETV